MNFLLTPVQGTIRLSLALSLFIVGASNLHALVVEGDNLQVKILERDHEEFGAEGVEFLVDITPRSPEGAEIHAIAFSTNSFRGDPFGRLPISFSYREGWTGAVYNATEWNAGVDGVSFVIGDPDNPDDPNEPETIFYTKRDIGEYGTLFGLDEYAVLFTRASHDALPITEDGVAGILNSADDDEADWADIDRGDGQFQIFLTTPATGFVALDAMAQRIDGGHAVPEPTALVLGCAALAMSAGAGRSRRRGRR